MTADKNRFVRYFKESLVEFKKVSWASKHEVVLATGRVIVFIFVMSSVLGLFDVLVRKFVLFVFS